MSSPTHFCADCGEIEVWDEGDAAILTRHSYFDFTLKAQVARDFITEEDLTVKVETLAEAQAECDRRNGR
jgi:hypothetical protein